MMTCMSQRVTISIPGRLLDFVERSALRAKTSRSRVIQGMIEESRRRHSEKELAELARRFFEVPLTREESEEQAQWRKASLETLRRER